MVAADDLVGVSLRYSWKVLNMRLTHDHLDAANLALHCYGNSFNYGKRIDAKNIRAFYHTGPEKDQIILPGTNEPKDWFMNNLLFTFDAGYALKHGIKIHRGFMRAANLLVNRLQNEKLLPKDKEKPIDIIGHSLAQCGGLCCRRKTP